MRYRVTEVRAVCEVRCTRIGGRGIHDCLECPHLLETKEITQVLSQEQYLDTLNCGNVYITKVELKRSETI